MKSAPKALFVIVIVTLLVTACAPQATPTSAPATSGPVLPTITIAPAIVAPTATVKLSPLMQKITASGKIVVGTSADYQPYEFKDAAGNFVGIDMDLIREIGKRLGYTVEIQDMGFDALIPALQGGKIDLVIADISETAERDKAVDFSIAYTAPEPQCFVANKDSTITVSTYEDVAKYKIGTQSGTSLEMLLKQKLVDTGLMPDSNLSRYQQADQAALDLQAGRVDLIYVNQGVANTFVGKMPVKIVWCTQGNPFGGAKIAVPKGSEDFLALLNPVVQKLLDEGFVDNLINITYKQSK